MRGTWLGLFTVVTLAHSGDHLTLVHPGLGEDLPCLLSQGFPWAASVSSPQLLWYPVVSGKLLPVAERKHLLPQHDFLNVSLPGGQGSFPSWFLSSGPLSLCLQFAEEVWGAVAGCLPP